ncbi:TatD family hydrolase [Aliiglaciecola sp. 3_MG-2023]|uniref:TatD family hydrolase n=1 Tax=Aliiglaciecola sp. 3_MG-2023 TaxID=3062644 RepID=UPI0026E26ACC|nr:TatD family hydrolase [Aliiglaciecola sp. 3_MG-2023]MDO6692326.1 TatD family hydrolase [Aliiglaciecola sp. 3_MG-2023]
MPHWFDIGINLPDKRLSLPDVIEHAVSKDVTGIILIGTDVQQSIEAHSIAQQFPKTLFSTAGIHPHNAKDAPSDYIQQLSQLASNNKIVAIGECGLDFNRNFSPPATQLRIFEQQLELACELQLPVYLHERDAFTEQLRLLKTYSSRLVGGVVHCFTGSIEQMEAYLELGFYIGITGWVCDPKRGESLREAVLRLPSDRMLLETDSPYLFPKTLKAKSRNNQPANIPHIAEFIANLRNQELQDLQQSCWQNTMDLFAIGANFEND